MSRWQYEFSSGRTILVEEIWESLPEVPASMFDKQASAIRRITGDLTADEFAHDILRRAGVRSRAEEAQDIMANVNRILPLGH